MLLIDELINIKKLHSATAIVNVKKKGVRGTSCGIDVHTNISWAIRSLFV